jgi:plasmid stabilization system protein ParE
MTKVTWALEARTRLEDIESFIAQENATAAKETVAAILARARQLQTAPLSGRQIPDYREDDLRELLERPYRIIYRVKHDSVEVLTVMHYRQLLPHKSTHLHQLSK